MKQNSECIVIKDKEMIYFYCVVADVTTIVFGAYYIVYYHFRSNSSSLAICQISEIDNLEDITTI